MKLRLTAIVPVAMCVLVLCDCAQAQQPKGAAEALRDLCSQPANRSSFTFDKNMLEGASALFGDQGGDVKRAVAELDSITVENYHYREPAFYQPEVMSALWAAYNAAGWKHLIDQNAAPRDAASPRKPITDLWLHFHGTDVDHVTVLVRGIREMNVIEVSGAFRPMDFVHLSGHFGIPKVDPGAVMVPAPPGK